jgi:hypothetical protein
MYALSLIEMMEEFVFRFLLTPMLQRFAFQT